ncbi:polysaccharide deacetylase family protein [Microbacterium sp. nov. GSS16]|uniref:polysaccharide deacetylase family protein n=1 Tax=Microbacterium sp. nov. GSS16 TaxID=3019890 RepID=UPI0023055728|nr:polysaccharide deacetylase family protein [Microbacterium sp. nov. GSS16]WCD92909.1 polysaccharide deacetylase family protein [Microbacterium sp. nov. GSS16]
MTAKAVSAPHVITLNFHGVGEPTRSLEPGEERFWITPENFHRVLDVAIAHKRYVEFTFDDGNESDHRIGLPALLARQARARFFVITDRIGMPGSLSSTQMLDLAESGMGIGTHGASHRPWTELARTGELRRELIESSQTLQQIVGRPTRHAALPHGLYDRAVLDELRVHDFLRVYTLDEGWSRARPWLRNRYSILRTDTADSIRRLLDSPNRAAGLWPLRPIRQAVKKWR